MRSFIFVLRKRTLRAVLWKPPQRLRQGREKMRPPPRPPPSSMLAPPLFRFLYLSRSRNMNTGRLVSIFHALKGRSQAEFPSASHPVHGCDALQYNARVGVSGMEALTSHPRGEGGAQAVCGRLIAASHAGMPSCWARRMDWSRSGVPLFARDLFRKRRTDEWFNFLRRKKTKYAR